MRRSIAAAVLPFAAIAVACLPQGANAFVPPAKSAGGDQQQCEQQVVELRMADDDETEAQSDPPANLDNGMINQEWIQCDKCKKWRQVRDLPEDSGAKWYCSMHPERQWQSCRVPQEKEEEDAQEPARAAQPPAKKRKGQTSDFSGVAKSKNQWKAKIHVGQGYYLGVYNEEEDAARLIDARETLG